MRAPTPEEQCALTAGAAMWSSVAVPDADIPAFTMSDGPMGIASGRVDERDIALLSPCATALGASWDRELAFRVGALVGGEAVARGVDAVLAPNINLARSPLAGRAFEYFSEDPLLTSVLGAAWIKGLQSTGTGSVAKHLVCNDSETARDSVDVRVDERTLREVYLLPFEMAAEAGCVGMLAAYNRVNGRWCAEQRHVMTDIVKGEWGYTGLIMSDWFGTHAGANSINAGLDLEMPGPARFMGPKLLPALADGSLANETLAAAAARVATAARRVKGAKAMPTDAPAPLLEAAAAAGFVLLRNQDDMLPCAPSSVKRIAVIGPNAQAPCYQGGTFAKIAVAPDTPTPIDAIRARYGDMCEVVFEPGVDPQPRLPAMPVTPALDVGDGCTTGMTLEYFDSTDCSGPARSRETRATNSLVWFVGVHDQGRFDEAGSVRASGWFTPDVDGDHRFYLGSTGVVEMTVDGGTVLKCGKALSPGDVMGALKRGDAESVAVPLRAGVRVRVTVAFSYTPARVHGLWYGVRAPDSAAAMLARAVDAAKSADAVFLIVGETSDSSVESKDRPDTKLAPAQLVLIDAVTAANPRTAVIVNVGHAFDASWDTRAAAVMAVWYPGQGYAAALAKVLAGDLEPGGRLPVSIAQREEDYCGYNLTPDPLGYLPYTEATCFGYRGLIRNATPARHAFGSGMGYAQFAWSNISAAGGVVSCTVRNVSDRAGSEVVQLYRDAPETALIGFAKVHLQPGETQRVDIAVTRRAMSTWANGWVHPTGPVNVRVARSAEDAGTAVALTF
jgi:beta-glucosidase